MKAALLEGAEKIGVVVSDEIADALETHYQLLTKWAKRMNLTAIKDPVEAAHLHYLDSLLFAELIDPEDRSRTVDVGSGAGFPGIPLALARPNLEMTLMEPIRKRASFLHVALAELGLDRVRVMEARLEDVTERFDLLVSRATIPPLELVRLAEGRADRVILTSGAHAPALEALPGAVRRIERRLPGGELRILDVVQLG